MQPLAHKTALTCVVIAVLTLAALAGVFARRSQANPAGAPAIEPPTVSVRPPTAAPSYPRSSPAVGTPAPVHTPGPSLAPAPMQARATSPMRQAAFTYAPTAGPVAPRREVNAAAQERAVFQNGASAGASTLPSPRAQDAASKEFIEGHWLGLEVIPLTAELAREYRIPPGEEGVLVDEITLESAESGILAGDMVHSIDGYGTPDLRAFFLGTQLVKEQRQATVEVGRRGTIMTFVLRARNTNELGFAQMEAAQPIRPGAVSPHRSRGKPCTSCHIIMTSGGQLPTDAGDIVRAPPPIPQNAQPPHAYRGPCRTCHQIIP